MQIGLSCAPVADGWSCTVTIGDDAGATVHEVSVEPAVLDELAPHSSVDELVRASFEFLLEREPRESIMRRFELPIITRFFPDYPAAMRARLGG